MSAAFLVKAVSRGPEVPVFVLGSLLPDLVSRVPAAAALFVNQHFFPVPAFWVYFWNPFHLPLGILLTCCGVSFLFPQQRRATVLPQLLAAGALHLLLDVLQRHTGLGYMLLYPFSTRDFEVGIIGSEASVGLAPFLLILVAALWRWRRGTWNLLALARSSASPPEARP
jgi:hypothetical protein